MKKKETKKSATVKEASTKSVDEFLRNNFSDSFFSLYNPKHSNYQAQKLNEKAPAEEDKNGFSSPLSSYLLKDDQNYQENREKTIDNFGKLYPKICQEVIDPVNDIPIAFVQKF